MRTASLIGLLVSLPSALMSLGGCGGGAEQAPADTPSTSHSGAPVVPAVGDPATPEGLFAAYKAAVERRDAETFIALHSPASRNAWGKTFKQMFTGPVEEVQRRSDDPGKAAELARARNALAENLRKLDLSSVQFTVMTDEQFLLIFLQKAFAGESGLDIWVAEFRETAAGTLKEVHLADDKTAGTLIVDCEIAQGVTDPRDVPIVREGDQWQVNTGLNIR